ncbi:hypothetical protein [Paenibacillus protaetiae]|uniref:hypothetical protein n=1 Tax=Paenibacillus protaetiae TaxID=2509456 RepID=UPI001ABED9CE|nr:hypothetical protein [Paenibacillus protaetiae]
MLNEKQTERMLGKLKRFETTIEPLIFTKVDSVEMGIYRTRERLHHIPEQALFSKAAPGERWGGKANIAGLKGSTG